MDGSVLYVWNACGATARGLHGVRLPQANGREAKGTREQGKGPRGWTAMLRTCSGAQADQAAACRLNEGRAWSTKHPWMGASPALTCELPEGVC